MITGKTASRMMLNVTPQIQKDPRSGILPEGPL